MQLKLPLDFSDCHFYPSKKKALVVLENIAFVCVEWMEGKKRMSAIYWNGRRQIQPSNLEKNWN